MSNHVILLSDIPNQNKETFAARYAGPYVIKSNLISAGFKTIVLDWFRYIKDNDKFLSGKLSAGHNNVNYFNGSLGNVLNFYPVFENTIFEAFTENGSSYKIHIDNITFMNADKDIR